MEWCSTKAQGQLYLYLNDMWIIYSYIKKCTETRGAELQTAVVKNCRLNTKLFSMRNKNAVCFLLRFSWPKIANSRTHVSSQRHPTDILLLTTHNLREIFSPLSHQVFNNQPRFNNGSPLWNTQVWPLETWRSILYYFNKKDDSYSRTEIYLQVEIFWVVTPSNMASQKCVLPQYCTMSQKASNNTARRHKGYSTTALQGATKIILLQHYTASRNCNLTYYMASKKISYRNATQRHKTVSYHITRRHKTVIYRNLTRNHRTASYYNTQSHKTVSY